MLKVLVILLSCCKHILVRFTRKTFGRVKSFLAAFISSYVGTISKRSNLIKRGLLILWILMAKSCKFSKFMLRHFSSFLILRGSCTSSSKERCSCPRFIGPVSCIRRIRVSCGRSLGKIITRLFTFLTKVFCLPWKIRLWMIALRLWLTGWLRGRRPISWHRWSSKRSHSTCESRRPGPRPSHTSLSHTHALSRSRHLEASKWIARGAWGFCFR